jgi:glutathione S-transferase
MRLYDYAASCNCYKVRLLLAQLGLEYERVPIDIFAGETLTDEYARINPARATPVLETDDGRFLPDSSAILMYLASGTRFLPDDPFLRAQVVRWLIYEQTEVVMMIGGLRFRLSTKRLDPSSPSAARRREGGLGVLSLLNDHLGAHEFFVDERYTIADIAIYGYIHVAHEAGFELLPYAAVRSWLQRVTEQPAFMEDVEPYPANSIAGASRSIYD